MFDTPLQLIYVPQACLSLIQACALPVLRLHQHDDVLPDLPEGTELLPQYTLHRPAAEWAEEETCWTADASDGFAGTQQHTGLIITATSSNRRLGAAGVFHVHSSTSNRFPWHPSCQHISARGCSVGAAELQEAAARGRAYLERQQAQQSLQQQTWWPAQLVPVAVQDEQPFLQDLAAAIRAHNAKVLQQQEMLQAASNSGQQQAQQQLHQLIVPLLASTVHQTAAAVAVQSAWRSHHCRLQEGIADRLLGNRAARSIQRSWRTFVLRSRLLMLSAAAAAYRHAQTQLRFSCIMCVDVASVRLMEAAAECCRAGSALFPEHRLGFVKEPEGGDLFLVQPPTSNSSSDDDSVSREGLSIWLGADIPVIPADCSAATGAYSRANVATLLEQCCSIKDLLDPQKVRAGACSHHDVAQLVTFRSKQQAAQCAALLAAYTYDVRTGQYAKLMTVQESPLGAAYRNLTTISTATTLSTNNCAASMMHPNSNSTSTSGAATAPGPAAAAARISPRSRPHAAAAATGGSSSAAAGRPLVHKHAASMAAGKQKHQGNQQSPNTTAASARSARRAPQQPTQSICSHGGGTAGDPAAAAEAPTSALDASAAPSTTSSPRTLGYAVPLQPIRPTGSLLAAAADTACANSAQTGSSPAAAAAAAAGASGLQFHVSVLARFPFLVKELAAGELHASGEQIADMLALSLEDSPGPASICDQDTCNVHHGRDGISSGGTSSGEGDAAHALRASDDCCIISQPPTKLHGKPGVNSLGAYLERIKLQQVDAFKVKLADEAKAAADAATAESLAKQQAIAAAKETADASGIADITAALLNTSNISTPYYWPDTIADAAAAAQAFKQQTAMLAAARLSALRELRQLAASRAALNQDEQRQAVKAAAQADKRVTKWRLQQEQYHHQASTQQRADTLRAVRTAAPAIRHKKEQQVAAFAKQCNKLSKFLRNDISHKARAAEQAAAAQAAQQQRQSEVLAAAALQQHKQDTQCAAQQSVALQKLTADADLAAARAIHKLEEAAKRAAVAARRHHEQNMAGFAGRLC